MGSPQVLVDSSALISNLRVLQAQSRGLPLFPTLKADAYGHGAQLVARILEKEFSRHELPYFCLARTEEARVLRKSGIKSPLLILSSFSEEDFSEGWPKTTDLVLSCDEDIELLKKIPLKKRGALSGVHLNFNTGMNRLGWKLDDPLDMIPRLEQLAKLKIPVRGLMTHLARAEERPALLSDRQVDAFEAIVAHLRLHWNFKRWGEFPEWVHLCNSSGLRKQLGTRGLVNAARPGLLLWGVYQDQKDLSENSLAGIQPVLSARAPLRQIFWIEAGEGVGYGHRFVAARRTLVGTITLGYADGISRSLSQSSLNTASIGFVVNKVRVPIIGTVSMDMTMVDLTDHPVFQKYPHHRPIDNWAWWIGAGQTVEQIAKAQDTVSYEVLCALGHRIPRQLKSEIV